MQDTISILETLRKAVQIVNGALQEQEIIEALLDQAVSASGARAAVLRLVSPKGDELLQAGVRGLSEAYQTKGPVWIAESAVDQRILAGQTMIIPDVTQDRNVQYPAAAAAEKLKGMIATPLRVRSQIIGVLRVYVDDTTQLRPEDLVAIGILADLVVCQS